MADSSSPSAKTGEIESLAEGGTLARQESPEASATSSDAVCAPAKTADYARGGTKRKRNTAIFFAVFACWLLLDIATKKVVENYSVGQTIAGPFLDLFRVKLVHNTGMAWGLLSDSTFLLGVTSVIVCVVLTVYFFAVCERASWVQSLGMSLVVAGGLGNALDRFLQGYVVDFIDLAFMDFPVFNIADIGVTCGFILFLGALAYEMYAEEKSAKRAESDGAQ